jgi:lipopolysaccharide export system permease protein
MLTVALSHHVLAPASLASFRVLLTHVRADIIATLVQPGGFRAVDDGLTMHFRDKTSDGTFRDIFVNDERDPKESMTFTAAHGVLLQHAGGSYLVLQDGNLIRTDNVKGSSNVVSFETYALDLSQLGTPNAAPVYEAMERSTLFLLDPEGNDSYSQAYPQRVRAEIHERTTAPLFTLTFGLIALAFLGQPHSNRQSRGAAIVAVVALCLLLRALGFAATAIGRNLDAAIPFMYAAPLLGIAFGIYAMTRGQALRVARPLVSLWDGLVALARQMARRNLALAGLSDRNAP